MFCSSTFGKEGMWFAIEQEKSPYVAFLRFEDKKLFFYPVGSPRIILRENESDGVSAIAIDGKMIWLGKRANLVQFDMETKKIGQTYFLGGLEKRGSIGFNLFKIDF